MLGCFAIVGASSPFLYISMGANFWLMRSYLSRRLPLVFRPWRMHVSLISTPYHEKMWTRPLWRFVQASCPSWVSLQKRRKSTLHVGIRSRFVLSKVILGPAALAGTHKWRLRRAAFVRARVLAILTVYSVILFKASCVKSYYLPSRPRELGCSKGIVQIFSPCESIIYLPTRYGLEKNKAPFSMQAYKVVYCMK